MGRAPRTQVGGGASSSGQYVRSVGKTRKFFYGIIKVWGEAIQPPQSISKTFMAGKSYGVNDMRIKDITTAKRNFDNAMENLGQKFTTTCYNFVVELRGAIDGDEDWSVIEARAFGEKLSDLRASLAKGGCTNPSVYSTKVRKAACAAVCLYPLDAELPKTLEALVKAYDKEWPSKSKGGTKAKGKAAKGTKSGKGPTPKLSIELSKLAALVVSYGLTQKQAEKLVSQNFADALLDLVKVS